MLNRDKLFNYLELKVAAMLTASNSPNTTSSIELRGDSSPLELKCHMHVSTQSGSMSPSREINLPPINIIDNADEDEKEIPKSVSMSRQETGENDHTMSPKHKLPQLEGTPNAEVGYLSIDLSYSYLPSYSLYTD